MAARRYDGKVVLVTGASSGIGRACCVELARQGALIFATGRKADALEATVAACAAAAAPGKSAAEKTVARAGVGDVTKEEDVKRVVAACIEAYGKLDVLVCSAGVIKTAAADAPECDAANFDFHFNVNTRGVFLCMHHCIPHLKKTKGNIVNISSVNGQQSFACCMTYCASKAAVDMMTKCAAVDLAPHGVRVNTVNPGVIITELHTRGGKTPEQYQAFLEKCSKTHPIGRCGRTEEVAQTVAYLGDSSIAGFVTGTSILIDGGRSCLGAR